MVDRLKKLDFRFSIRTTSILCVLVFCMSSFFVYFFSEDSKIKALVCTGNTFYSDSELYQTAKISTQTRPLLTPKFILEDRLESLPLVQSASVYQEGKILKIEITEQTVIGYYVSDNKNYALPLKGDPIEIGEDHLEDIVHFPLIAGFSKKQRTNLQKQFQEHQDVLGKEIIEKIAEIVPYESSYDENMLQITMQDGNKVYTSMNSLYMLSNYTSLLSSLQGKSACLFLDSENSAIEKVNCDSFDLAKKEEKKEEEKKEKEQQEEKEKTEAAPEEEETAEDPEKEENVSEEDASSEDEQQPEEDYYSSTADWVVDENAFGMEYSAALDLYYDSGTSTYYRWNETTLSFDVVN